MSAGSCKTIICNYDEITTLKPGWCLETFMREICRNPVIAEAIGDLEVSDPKLFNHIVEILGSAQMDSQQQEELRRFLLDFAD
jgi:hypothetical protein